MGEKVPWAKMVFPSGRPRVLDVGYGTGFWLYDMAHAFPHAHLVGIDIAPPLPGHDMTRPGADLEFRSPVDFEREDWDLNAGSYDLVHMSQLCGSVSDWARLCANALRSVLSASSAPRELTTSSGTSDRVQAGWSLLRSTVSIFWWILWIRIR